MQQPSSGSSGGGGAPQQQEAILRAIAVSFLPQAVASATAPSSNEERQAAFALIEEFKTYPGRIPIVLQWITSVEGSDGSGRILCGSGFNNGKGDRGVVDVTVPVRLLACEILQTFLQREYSKISESDRVALRHAVLQACRVVAAASLEADPAVLVQQQQQQELRIVAKKLAALLEGLVIRDFPQRWTTFAEDIFSPLNMTVAPASATNNTSPAAVTRMIPTGGGLWYSDGPNLMSTVGVATENFAAATTSIHLGVNMCLEMLRLVAEDCTDSDFNSKISTARRNDVLIGLNEIRHRFLPKFYGLLSATVPALQRSRDTLKGMHQFLVSQSRTVAALTAEERSAYQAQRTQRQNTAQLLHDVFVMLEKFASSFPLVWILGSPSSSSSLTATSAPSLPVTASSSGGTTDCDFLKVVLYMFGEREASVQLRAIECVEMLACRGKLEFREWMRLVREVPDAFELANQQFSVWFEHRQAERQAAEGSIGSDEHPLALQLEFHRSLSRMMATVISSHLLHLSNSSKQVSDRSSPTFTSIQNFLGLLVKMLHHPSGRMCTEQVAMWTSLFRDPMVAKTGLLEPFVEEVMGCYMDHLVKVRWQDVENRSHPAYQVLEASFDDEDDYDTWTGEFRSRSSNLFKYIGNVEPVIASRLLQTRVHALLASHGSGQPLTFLDPINQQLTQHSDAVIQLEALLQPLDNTLSGIPSWVISPDSSRFSSPDRNKVATAARALLSELARDLVNWNPSYLWLKFRRAALLEPLKYIWEYDASTLLPAVDSLLRYLGLADEWKAPLGPAVTGSLSGEVVGLKKKSGVTLVAISKKIPHHLVPWLVQLSEATRNLLSSEGLIPMNQMHLYEFLTCVVSAVDDPRARSQFVSDVLVDAVKAIESVEVQQMVQSSHALLSTLGVANAQVSMVTDPSNVKAVTGRYVRIFTAYNRLLSVGRRCHEASKRRILEGRGANHNDSFGMTPSDSSSEATSQLNFADEGPVSIQDLSLNDPFVHLWPRILPPLLMLYESILTVWRPEHQAVLLSNPLQRYVYAISDDEAFLALNQNGKSGGVFGEGGTAGSVVAGTDRRHINLLPKFAGWFNELRNSCFQLLALLSAQRGMFAPELVHLYPRIVAVITDPLNLRSMEHRHITQFLTHVVELLLVSCPSTMYASHLAPILGPVVEHLRYRLEKTWLPIIQSTTAASTLDANSTKALRSQDCTGAAALAEQGGEAWFSWYYAHAGLFVGDADDVTAESVVEKCRVDLGRTYSDVLQTALALKGEWALVLANRAKEELAIKRNDPRVLMEGPSSRINEEGVVVNADGTTRTEGQSRSDARSILRINGLCHFLLLENEQIAFNLTLTVIQCLSYPDAYTCRRVTKICHRILETVAWSPLYNQVIGQQMFTQAVKNIVAEPKWMVGMEWDMINVVRDILCRLVLGQTLQNGGQGAALQQASNGPDTYEQAKSADKPLSGGGILTTASPYPRQVLQMLPGVNPEVLRTFERALKEKPAAKSQKDCIRDLLREAADRLKELQSPGSSAGSLDGGNAAGSIFDRAVEEESLLHSNRRAPSYVIPDLPEKLVTSSQVAKAMSRTERQENRSFEGLSAFQL